MHDLGKLYSEIRVDVRNKTIEEVIGIVNARLVIGLGLENATKYGNVNSKQQTNSYSTLMRYEIADVVKDLLDVLEQMKEGGEA